MHNHRSIPDRTPAFGEHVWRATRPHRSPYLCSWLVALWLLATPGERTLADNSPSCTLAHGSGALAAKADDRQPWLILLPGEALPERCELRSGAVGTNWVQCPKGMLGISWDTRLQWRGPLQPWVLQSGTADLRTNAGQTWSAAIGDASLDVSESSAVEASFQPSQSLVVRVLEGTATLRSGKLGPLQVAAGTAARWSADQAAPTTMPLDSQERKQLARRLKTQQRAQGLGQLVVQDPQSESPARLQVARYHVHVVLQPPVALVQIDQSFYNPYPVQREGTFVFNLPRGASVSRFAMYTTPTQLIEGELIERHQADSIYRSIVNRRRDPAILEQIGDSLFRMRVFPIFANDTKRILLDFTLPLESAADLGRFRLPLLSDLQPIWDFQLSGVIKGPTAFESVRSLTHPGLKFSRKDNAVAFEYRQQSYRPQSDFGLEFRQQVRPEATLRSYIAEPLPRPRNERNLRTDDPWSGRTAMYFMVSVPPAANAARGPQETPGRATGGVSGSPASATAEAPAGKPLGESGQASGARPPQSPAPADVLILADTSSGMQGRTAVQQTVRTIVHNLPQADRFRVWCVDLTGRPVHEGWLEPGSKASAAALDNLDRQFALGATDLLASFREALSSYAGTSTRRRLVIYIGDGQNTSGSESANILPTALAEELNRANASLFNVLVREDPQGRQVLESTSRATGGLVFDLVGRNGGNQDFLVWLLDGLPSADKIVNVEVERTAAEDAFSPVEADGTASKDLFFPTAWLPSRELQIFGRCAMTSGMRVRVTVARQGRPQTLEWIFQRRTSAVGAEWQLAKPSAAPAAGAEAPSPALPQTARLASSGTAADEIFLGRLWAQQRLDSLRREEAFVVDQVDPRAQTLRQQSIEVSREWSLLSPHTAFLVLETEQDYQRWKIDRQQRRRYWRPAEAVPQEPLPPGWLRLATPDPQKAQAEREVREFAQALKSAREALAAKHYALAESQLTRVRKLPAAGKSSEYAELEQETRTALQAEAFTQALGLHRSLFDPQSRSWSRPEPNLASLFRSTLEPGPDFARRHPYFRQLQTAVDVLDPGKLNLDQEFNLESLASLLRTATKANVVLDVKALENVGVEHDVPLRVQGSGWMSLRNFARFALRQKGLVLSEEPYRLLITSSEEAERALATEVYPVGDILTEHRVADLERLVDPLFDQDSAAADRIRAKLQRPVSVKFQKESLTQVIECFTQLLDDTILVDAKSLDNVGVSGDASVTASWQNVPAKLSLQWILKDLGLTYYVDADALVITSHEEADRILSTRLYSVRGLVEVAADPAWQPGSGGRRTRGDWGVGLGGGMGGFAGGMGGFAGGMGGTFGGPATGGSAPVSAGGPPTATPSTAFGGAEDAVEDDADAADELAPDASPWPTLSRQAGWSRPLDSLLWSGGGAAQVDGDFLTDLVTSQIAPQTWSTVGGIGTIEHFPLTLDMVISQTEVVHEQIAAFLERLRRLPRYGAAPAPRVKPAQLPESAANLDFDTLIDLITQSVAPPSWSSVGGPGDIGRDPVHAALVLSQTPDVHDSVSQLLMLLRRSRYQAVKGTEPWKSLTGGSVGPAVSGLGIAEAASDLRLSKLPEPKPEELALLAVRRGSPGERQAWVRRDTGQGAAEIVRWARSGRQLHVNLSSVDFLAEGEELTIGYSNLGLVEHGLWAEAARQVVDTCLPWLPHRLNEELARLFDVRAVPPSKADTDANLVRLRLVPLGQAEPARSYLDVTFSKQDGLPHSWDSYFQGQLTARLRFENLTRQGDSADWSLVTLADASGKPLVRWEAVPATAADAAVLQPPAAWKDFVHLDRRAKQPAVDGQFHEALNALWQAQWPVAWAKLDAALKVHPQHPFLLLLKVWCHDREPTLGNGQEVVSLLKTIAASKHTGLTRFIAQRPFTWLEPRALYDVLAQQPPELREARDWNSLAHAAADAGDVKAALRHSLEAVRSPTAGPGQFERRRFHVELLLRSGQADAACQAAQGYARQEGVPAEQLAGLSDLLAAHSQKAVADELLVAALNTKPSEEQRAALLHRRADLVEGLPRWKLLLETAALLSAGPRREQCLTALTNELHQPAQAEVAASLVPLTKDVRLQAALLVRQAELTRDAAGAAEAAWRAFQTKQLGADWLNWAFQRWNRAQQWERVIRTAEGWLLSGKPLPEDAADELAEAYRRVGRSSDARRAATRDPVEEASSQGRFPPPRGGMGSMSGGVF